MARPYTQDESDVIKKEFLKIYEEELCQAYLTCRRVGIRPTTYYYWREHDKEFDDLIKEAEERYYDKVESCQKRDIIEKGGIERIFYMKKKMKHRGYGDDPVTINQFGEAGTYRLTETDETIMARHNAQVIAQYKASLKDNPEPNED